MPAMIILISEVANERSFLKQTVPKFKKYKNK